MHLSDVIMYAAKLQDICINNDKVSDVRKMLKSVKKYSPLIQRKEYNVEQVDCNKTLNEVLKNKADLSEFREFLKSEYSDENIDFWLKCEFYKQQNISNRKKIARKIYEKFVAANSPKEVNLDFKTRECIKESLSFPSVDTFDVAQDCVFKLMERDSFKRFLKMKNLKKEECNFCKKETEYFHFIKEENENCL